MKSMTGFGFFQFKNKNFQLKISVKSLNSRFTDIKLNIPPFYRALESELKKIISQYVSRGQFVVHIDRFPSYPSAHFHLNWDKKQAKKWKELYSNLSREMSVKNDLKASDFTRMEGVIRAQEVASDLSSEEKNQAKATLKKALQACLKERAREGATLKKDILNHIKNLQTLLMKIKKLNAQQERRAKNHYKQIVKEKNEVSEKEKWAIDEEIVRFTEHLRILKKMAQNDQAPGRKLDFYIQELVREMNTIGSKSQISALTLQVIEGKSILEKIREQAQNLE